MSGRSRSARRGFRAALAVITATAFVVLGVVVSTRPAWAHGGDESDEASVLARQAIALMVNTPKNTMAIEERIDDTLDAKDAEGVNLDLVKQAKETFDAGDLHRARALLEVAIGAKPHLSDASLLPVGQTAGPATDAESAVRLVTGEEAGTNVVVDPLDVQRRLDAGTWVALIAAFVVGVIGVALAIRFRPPVPMRSLRSAPTRER